MVLSLFAMIMTASCVDPVGRSEYLVMTYIDAPWIVMTKEQVSGNAHRLSGLMRFSEAMSGYSDIDQSIYMALSDAVAETNGQEYHTYSAGSDVHRQLSEKHNDIPPSPLRGFGTVAEEWGYYFVKDFVSLEVTSDQDFDAQHPAGTSLLDVLHFGTNTPYRVLRNNYQWKFDTDVLIVDITEGVDVPEAFPFRKKQLFNTYKCGKDVRPEDMTILGFHVLSFDKLPDPVGPRNIQIRMTADDGTVYDFSTVLTFQKVTLR